jgi:transcriptional regulator with XRE-family HTH domain
MRDVGRRVAELRAVRGWTQEAFAERAEVSVGYVRQVEGGRENLTIATLCKLAAVLDADAADLFAAPSTSAQRGRPRRT